MAGRAVFLGLPYLQGEAEDSKAQVVALHRRFRGSKFDSAVHLVPLSFILNHGSLDNLLECSEMLAKVDSLGEAVSSKHLALLDEVHPSKVAKDELAFVDTPARGRVSAVDYLKEFVWDEGQYPHSHPVKLLIFKLQKLLNETDNETKKRVQEYTELKNRELAASKKTKGNLTVKPIATIIEEWARKRGLAGGRPIESEYLTTLFAVIPKAERSAWESSYVTLDLPKGKALGEGESWIVPQSSELVYDDEESRMLMMSVIVFKKHADGFRNGARGRRWTVREYEPQNEPTAAEVAAMQAEVATTRGACEEWLSNAFSAVYTAWVHIKVIRLCVEAILRYGLPPRFIPLVAVVLPDQEQALRKTLKGLFEDKKASKFVDDTTDGNAVELQYPYVSVTMDLIGLAAAPKAKK